MTDFQLSTTPYIALVRREDIGAPPDCPICLAVYAPGTTCADWRYHQDNAAFISYGFLAYWHDDWSLLGETCLSRYFPGTQTQSWKTALDNRHPFAGTGLPDDWRRRTRKRYWRLMPLIGLMLQVESRERTRGLLHGYIEWATRDKAEFSDRQKHTLLAILRERGVRKRNDWSQEIEGHKRILKTRRDLAFRLARLAALDLSPDDLETVRSLQRWNTGWSSSGRMRQLSPAQVGLVRSREAQYLEQRRETTEAWGQALAREFRLEPSGR